MTGTSIQSVFLDKGTGALLFVGTKLDVFLIFLEIQIPGYTNPHSSLFGEGSYYLSLWVTRETPNSIALALPYNT